MAWTQVAAYAIRWNSTSKKGKVNLWFAGVRIDPESPHDSLKDLDATELAAMAMILRSDPDHKVAFDKDKRELAGGFDLP
jgi:hypothetical protein